MEKKEKKSFLTLSEIAEKAGLSKFNVIHCMNGKKKLSSRAVLKLLDAYDAIVIEKRLQFEGDLKKASGDFYF